MAAFKRTATDTDAIPACAHHGRVSLIGMDNSPKQHAAALSLMRMALALLDRDGERCGAAYLQQAIDVTARVPIPTSEADIDPELLARFERGELP